jgi:hypothetical protein
MFADRFIPDKKIVVYKPNNKNGKRTYIQIYRA